MAQFVELAIDAITNHPTLLHQLWRVVLYLTSNTVSELLTKREALSYPAQRLVGSLQTGSLDRFDSL